MPHSSTLLAEPVSAPSQCAACAADCLEACFNDAIVAAERGGVEILEDNCAGCGACVPACDFGLIRLQDGVAQFRLPAASAKAPRP
ncbi:Fe-S-cluster-containing hydrogenase component 2 [Rhodoblastus acidophilus]|uniref:4Fe-4S dicluster domain-containing protein n=1 Tax=Rhodoblastus acidophilus TaxID=1074 RepID=UPI00222457D6|nr:4Fe-4S binding protein [Rhodoblastus acidophilus]MCW2285595.1 Fe-S-cluster-containing hydrogenase component 2 [Rhodoblastus acidophilus]MCW2334489.1 Fe-S-cluster-containing hydrogenase component 2 [Rhodoblastus acidophilus]